MHVENINLLVLVNLTRVPQCQWIFSFRSFILLVSCQLAKVQYTRTCTRSIWLDVLRANASRFGQFLDLFEYNCCAFLSVDFAFVNPPWQTSSRKRKSDRREKKKELEREERRTKRKERKGRERKGKERKGKGGTKKAPRRINLADEKRPASIRPRRRSFDSLLRAWSQLSTLKTLKHPWKILQTHANIQQNSSVHRNSTNSPCSTRWSRVIISFEEFFYLLSALFYFSTFLLFHFSTFPSVFSDNFPGDVWTFSKWSANVPGCIKYRLNRQ